jgi:hypothetical protein
MNTLNSAGEALVVSFELYLIGIELFSEIHASTEIGPNGREEYGVD